MQTAQTISDIAAANNVNNWVTRATWLIAGASAAIDLFVNNDIPTAISDLVLNGVSPIEKFISNFFVSAEYKEFVSPLIKDLTFLSAK